MLLYLLRHAEAVPGTGSDGERVLTKKGIAQAKRVGRFCEKHGIQPEVILTSPLRRAEQTARSVARALKSTEVIVEPFLASGMQPEAALQELKAYGDMRCVMIVGHEPDFSHLVAQVLKMPSPASIRLRKASLTLIDLTGGTLLFSIPAKLM
jgi:phosphohistidine phosphatase